MTQHIHTLKSLLNLILIWFFQIKEIYGVLLNLVVVFLNISAYVKQENTLHS